jgi:hypothetical protein
MNKHKQLIVLIKVSGEINGREFAEEIQDGNFLHEHDIFNDQEINRESVSFLDIGQFMDIVNDELNMDDYWFSYINILKGVEE